MDILIKNIARQLNIKEQQVRNTLNLLNEGNTVPFIARYRKEMTQNLDEDQIRTIQEQFQYQTNLQKRKEDVMRLIETQGKLTDELKQEIEKCLKMSEVEDIYRPYQQKRKTRATEAIRQGLEPLANFLLSLPKDIDLNKKASEFLNEEVTTCEEAIQKAKDIIAERISDDPKYRQRIKQSALKGNIVTKAKKDNPDEAKVYQMYYEYEEKIATLAPHRIMAINRAEKEKVISVKIQYDEQYLIDLIIDKTLKKQTTVAKEYLEQAIKDGLKRLAFPAIEREIRNELTEKAHNQSIEIFSLNVEKLLLQPPMKDKMILGLDPAYRTGCKLAVIDSTGKMLEIKVIYPHPPVNKKAEAKKIIVDLINKYQINIIAIGNGTASRESEQFIADVIKENNLDAAYTIVSEAGASVYSASALAKQEFPDLHVEERSAISIARRLLDPLAELIKIDPQSIGVGQYQHDLMSNKLTERLNFVVEKAVNLVGVDVNTASIPLLKNVSGLNQAIATAIVEYREANGKFKNRNELLNVKKLKEKTFQQAAGFLRITDGTQPLDKTSIHPESYQLALDILSKFNLSTDDLGTEKLKEIIEKHEKEIETNYTIKDIIESFKQPLRDYRLKYDAPILRKDILTLDDLKEGIELEGVVRNVVDFGAFIDIGLKNDGLVHISKMSKQRINHPSQICQVGDIVKVWVDSIDLARQKVQLRMIK